MQKTKSIDRKEYLKNGTPISTCDKSSQSGYFSRELARFLFPRNPHQLVMARQRCSLATPVPVIVQHT